MTVFVRGAGRPSIHTNAVPSEKNFLDLMQKEHSTFIADFSVQGRPAYLSHQETLSFWQRLLIRAHLPLVFSLGFNPRPRVSLSLPRSVGVQSDCERLCVQVMTEGFCVETARRRLESLLPCGFVLTQTFVVEGKAAFYPASATYRFTLSDPPDESRQRHLQYCIEQTHSAEPILLMRLMEKGRQRPVDIRPFVEEVSLNGQVIETVCAIRGEGTVRMDELMRWLSIEPQELAEPIRRVAVRWVLTTNHLQGEHNRL